MNIHAIVNPTSAAGSTRGKIPRIRQLFEAYGAPCTLHHTRYPGHATALAQQAVRAGAELLVAVGGDGTISQVVQGMLSADGRSLVAGPAIGLLPSGTGGDLRRSLNLPPGLDAAVRQIITGPTHSLDVGCLEYTNSQQATRRRLFVNVASLGISATVSDLVNRRFKHLGGRSGFYLAAAWATTRHRNRALHLRAQERSIYSGPAYLLAFANGRYFGGGMRVAPHASLSDGELDCVLLEDFTRLEAFGLSRRIYRGTHLTHPKARALRAPRFDVELQADPTRASTLDVDGELLRVYGSVRVTTLPSALHLRGAIPQTEPQR